MVHRKIQRHFLLLLLSLILYSIGTPSVLAQTDNWISETRMPTGRTFLGACVVDEKFYVIGGASGTSATSAVEMYDPATDTWQKKANMPAARCYPQTCALNGKIYVFGGTTGMWSEAKKSVYLYDHQTDTWTQKSDMPYAIKDCGIAVVDSIIYLIGGSGGPSGSSLMAYNPITESWIQKVDMPTSRGMLSACVVDGKIYAIGGTTEDWENVFYKHVEVYDPVTNTWIQKTDMPTGRWALATVVVDGLIYAIGGRAGSYSSSKNEAYNPVTDTWVLKRSMQQTRTGLVAGAIGNKIYATGGHKGPPLVVLSSLEQYNPVVTAVAAKSELPIQQQQSFLYQNYPNPYNSTTQIRYSLNKPYFVRLEIYNVRGERIESAINEFKNAGNYSLILNTSQFSSGTYFYILYLDGQVSESRKMLYIK